MPTSMPSVQRTFPLASEAQGLGKGHQRGRHNSSVIQTLILNVIGSRNYIFKKKSSLCIALRGPQVSNHTLTLENQVETRLTGRIDGSASAQLNPGLLAAAGGMLGPVQGSQPSALCGFLLPSFIFSSGFFGLGRDVNHCGFFSDALTFP